MGPRKGRNPTLDRNVRCWCRPSINEFTTVRCRRLRFLIFSVRKKTVLEKVPQRCAVYGDRGDDSAALRTHWERAGREPMKIAFRAPRQEREGMKFPRLAVNQTIAKTRARVAPVLGAIQHDMGGVRHRGIGLRRAHSERVMEHLVYNLRRWAFLTRDSSTY